MAVTIPLATTAAANASSYATISGSGSSGASAAIDEWALDLRPAGIAVNYLPDGSAAGRADYIASHDVFADSDPPFRSGHDKLGGAGPEHQSGFSYIPDLAGGTAFPYHLSVHGHLITNLRLSPRTLLGIFTGQIINWDSPQITRDYGARLPDLPITPVIHAEGDGGTYFFTRWMAFLFPRQWNTFCDQVRPGITPPCGPTEFYPRFGHARAENGSGSVVTYIASRAGNGAIGYDEFALTLGAHIPVVKLRNPAGRYVLPTAASLTAALTRAVINFNVHSRDFLQQDLTKLYSDTDPRSYPLASYSYLIVPRQGTTLPKNFTRADGRTLSAFVVFALCHGQAQLARLG
jgi:ABC-type phosphate transport system substrate-binding protein